jgi:hypothetical protein
MNYMGMEYSCKEGKYFPNSGELKKYTAERNEKCAICWAPNLSKSNCNCKKRIISVMNEEISGLLHSHKPRVSEGKG